MRVSYTLPPCAVTGSSQQQRQQQQATRGSNAYGVASPQALQLYEELMHYRASLRLPSILLCSHLNQVAAWHAYDLQQTRPNEAVCNKHSWSSSTRWTGCCYKMPPTQAMAKCMWDKPRELSGGRYKGNGFEISAGGGTRRVTPQWAIQDFSRSPAHNEVVVNGGQWSKPWRAVGVGISEHYAVIWFGLDACPP